MKYPKNLLEAMNDLDDSILDDALKAPHSVNPKRKFLQVLAAAALIAAMSLTVYGVMNLGQWYGQWFARDGHQEMTPEQQTYLDENVIPVESEDEGIRLESALTDGVYFYMKLHVTAPEGYI